MSSGHGISKLIPIRRLCTNRLAGKSFALLGEDLLRVGRVLYTLVERLLGGLLGLRLTTFVVENASQVERRLAVGRDRRRLLVEVDRTLHVAGCEGILGQDGVSIGELVVLGDLAGGNAFADRRQGVLVLACADLPDVKRLVTIGVQSALGLGFQQQRVGLVELLVLLVQRRGIVKCLGVGRVLAPGLF